MEVFKISAWLIFAAMLFFVPSTFGPTIRKMAEAIDESSDRSFTPGSGYIGGLIGYDFWHAEAIRDEYQHFFPTGPLLVQYRQYRLALNIAGGVIGIAGFLWIWLR